MGQFFMLLTGIILHFLIGKNTPAIFDQNTTITQTPIRTIKIISTTPTPIPTITYINNDKQLGNEISPTSIPIEDQTIKCPLNGNTYQLTFSDCQHQLTLEENKYQQQLDNLPTAQQIMKQNAQDIQKYYNNLPSLPTIPSQIDSPTPNIIVVTPTPMSIPTSNLADCTYLGQQLTIIAGQIVATYAANGIDSSSGVVTSAIAQGTLDICFQLKNANCPEASMCQ